jgi:hypothetical protein
MLEKETLANRVKLFVWSVSAGLVIAFFFASNFLAWATNFNPGGEALFISPLMCGLILGIITCEMDAVNTVLATIIITVTTTISVILTLMSPFILGIVSDPSGTIWFIHVPQNILITVILVLPITLLGSILGRLFAENTILSSAMRGERAVLKSETEEWYKMLEEKLEEKKAALEKVRKEQEANMGAENSQVERPPAQ